MRIEDHYFVQCQAFDFKLEKLDLTKMKKKQ